MSEVVLLSTYELGHAPMGLALPAAFLQRAGIDARCIDLAIEPLDEAVVRQARFVGISVPMHTALRLGLAAARRVRSLRPDGFLAFYGLYAPLHRDLLLGEGADAVLGGELEEDLVTLARSVLEGQPRPPGATTPSLRKLDFPRPRRDGLAPLDRYAHLVVGSEQRIAGQTEASRGCLHRCRHCPIPAVYAGRFFVIPREIVLEDVRAQVALGARHITFGDPDFLNGPRHSLEIVRAVHAEHPDLTFDITAKVEHLLRHRTLLPELAASGCAFVVTALESLSDTVLARLDKGHDRAQAFELIDAMAEAGLPLRPSLLPFTPWSTLEDYLELLEVIADRDLVAHVDAVQLTIRLLVPPGSLLLASEAGAPWLGALDPSSLTFSWQHPDPRMDLLHRHVEAIARKTARGHEDAEATFAHFRRAAHAAAGAEVYPAGGPRASQRHEPPPRLSEPWFC